MKKTLLIKLLIFTLFSFTLFPSSIIAENSKVSVKDKKLEVEFPSFTGISEEYKKPIDDFSQKNKDKFSPNIENYEVTAFYTNNQGTFATLIPNREKYKDVKNFEDTKAVVLKLGKNKDTNTPEVSLYEPTFSSLQTDTTDYRFPWTENHSWKKTAGWYYSNGYEHQGYSKNNIDFAPVTANDFPVLSSGLGNITVLCQDGDQVNLAITHPNSDLTRYVHLNEETFNFNLANTNADRGTYLGDIYDGSYIDTANGFCKNEDGSITTSGLQYNTYCGCGTGPHLHFEVSRRDLLIQTYTADQVANSVSPNNLFTSTNSSLIAGCFSEESGNWVLQNDCTFNGSANVPSNLIIRNNSVLTIGNTAALNIDFAAHNLLVQNGSGVLIKNGGKIY